MDKAATLGLLGGIFSIGIGDIASSIGSSFLSGAVQTLSHAGISGVFSEASGGTYMQGFISGGVSSLGSSVGKALKAGPVGMIVIGMVSGGLSAELAGGNFWQGMRQGFIVGALNHALHESVSGGSEYSDDEIDGFKEFMAIVTGESSNDILEAQGIGEIILRRLEHVGAKPTKGFVEKIGGKKQFDAVGGKIYNEVISMSFESFFTINSSHKYYNRIAGAWNAILCTNCNISKGAYFWNASFPKTGFNWKTHKEGVFIKTATLGNTTFFKYSNEQKKIWP